MQQPSVFLYVHVLWRAEANAEPLKPAAMATMAGTLRQVAASRAIDITALAVLPDHVHVLLALPPIQSLQPIVQLLMQESQALMQAILTGPESFAWQQPFYAFSVSPNTLIRATEYIAHQQQWHATHSLDEEISKMMQMATTGA